MWGAVLGLVGLGLGIGGSVFSIFKKSEGADYRRQALEAQKRANQLQQKRNALAVRRQKLQYIREARIKRAAAVARAQSQTGGTGGSIQGGIGSIISQGSSGLGFLRQSSIYTSQARQELVNSTIFNNQAQSAFNQASIGMGIASIGGTIFDRRKDLFSIGRQVGIF